MVKIDGLPDVNSLVRDVARPEPVHFREVDTVFQALARLRSERRQTEPVYFYVTDSHERLVGVVPARRLLFSDPAILVGELMMHPVFSVSESATFANALALLAEQRLLALPVVDEAGRLTGLIDVSGMTQAIADLERREQAAATFHMTAVNTSKEETFGLAFALSRRFGWLLVSLASGLACAALLHFFATVLEKAIAVAFFLPLVVVIGERIAAQTAGNSLRSLQVIRQAPLKDWRIGLILGTASAAVAGIGAASWLRLPAVAGVVACSVLAATAAGLAAGYTVPRLVRHWRLETKVAMVPMVMALTDVVALSCYLGLAGAILR